MSIERPLFYPSPIFLAAIAALAVGGCCCHVEGPEIFDCPPARPVVADGLRTSEACADWRWIGELESAREVTSCPALPGWDVRFLFAGETCHRMLADLGAASSERSLDEETSAELQALRETADAACNDPSDVPAGLERFCLYERRGPVRARGVELDVDQLPGLARIERDCAVLLPMGSALEDAMRPALATHFLAEANRVDLPAAASPRVRLAIVDTAPTDGDRPELGPYNSPHGYTLANMAQALLCQSDGSGCVADVTARLALAYVSFHPRSRRASVRDPVNGGFVGMIGELAEAIRLEVGAWEGSGQRLILNLSVGWDRRFGDLGPDLDNRRPADVAAVAVHAALEHARDRGALTFAAAGNRGWGPDPGNSRDPLLPAAWEETAPAAARPLLYAVSGLRRDDTPLTTARFKGQARLAAFADHAIVEPPPGGPPTATLTGSSVAALVGSATAAAAWHFLPAAEPAAIAERVYEQGRALALQADFCDGGAANNCAGAGRGVRRALLCEAARTACLACSGPDCPSPCPSGPCPSTGAPPQLDTPLTRFARLVPAGERRNLLNPPRQPPQSLDRCPSRPIRDLGPAAERFHPRGNRPWPPFPCPQWQFPDSASQAWTGPQPGSNPCPNCGFGQSSQTLFLEIDQSYQGNLSSPALKVGNDLYHLDLNLVAGSTATVEDVPVDPGGEIFFVTVVEGAESGVSPVLILP